MAARAVACAVLIGAVLLPARLDPRACGGPLSFDLTPSIDWQLEEALGKIDSVATDYDYYPRDEFLFLYPAVASAREKLGDLWLAAYAIPFGADPTASTGGIPFGHAPDPGALAAAIEARDWGRTERVARSLVEEILDMPAPQASLHTRVLNQAVEVIELAPFIADLGDERAYDFFTGRPSDDDRPLPRAFEQAKAIRVMKRDDAARLLAEDPSQARAATLRFVVLAQAMRSDIANGWRADVAKETPPETWSRLEGLADAWLADFPKHPLADLVRLMKERQYYLHDRLDEAFRLLVETYARHPARALFEIRFLARQGYDARIGELLEKQVPPEIVAGFVHPDLSSLGPGDWDRLWALAEAHRGAPWATNLEERLLWLVARDATAPLPASYPSDAAAPTELWGELRLYALVRRGRWDEAERQTTMVKSGPAVDVMRGRILLARGEVWGAMRLALDETAREYVIRVLLRDDELAELASAGTSWERHEATVALGVRKAFAGDWRGAAELVRATDAQRARLWDEAARLATDDSTAGRLRWARFLTQHRGKIFHAESGPWNRSLDRRRQVCTYPGGIPRWRELSDEARARMAPIRSEWTPEYEREAIARHLLRNELWLALGAYVDYLEGAKSGRERAAALREADDAYNHLVGITFWHEYLSDSDVVHRLREIGHEVRAEPKR